MKLTHATLTLVLVGFAYMLRAQTPDLRYGKVSDEEWNMTYCDFDSTAPAVILLDKGVITFDNGTVNIERHRRIKIFREEGFEYADIQIPFYHRDKDEWIENFFAQTLVKGADGKVEKVKVKDEFTEQVNDYWSQFKFSFPAIANGVIIEYSYRYVSKRFYFLSPWEFQHELPVLYSELNASVPETLNYSFLLFGDQLPKRYTGGTLSNWVLEKQPGYKDEAFVYNPKDYINKIEFQLTSYWDGSAMRKVLRSWDQLGDDLRQEYRPLMRRARREKESFEAVIAEASTELEKVEALVTHFRKIYQWDNYFSIYPKQGLDELLTTGKGTNSLINLWFIGALKALGLNAEPVLISTRSNGKVVRNFPLLSQFNTVICQVNCDGKGYLIDVVERGGKLHFDQLPVEDLNYSGLLLGEDSTSWIDILPKVASKYTTLVELDLAAGTGKVGKRYMGYPAAEQRKNIIFGEALDLAKGQTVDGAVGQSLELLDQSIENIEETDQPLMITYLMKGDPVEADASTLYLTPLSWSNFQEVKFKKKERHFPVELEYPFMDQLSMSITLPPGYVLEEAPKDILLKLPNDTGQFTYRVNVLKDKCLIDIRMKINEVYLVPEMYFHLKEFFEQIKEKISESIVFKKM